MIVTFEELQRFARMGRENPWLKIRLPRGAQLDPAITYPQLRSLGFIPAFLCESTLDEVLRYLWLEPLWES